MTLDFVMLIQGITRETVLRNSSRVPDEDSYIWEHAERQGRLLRALLEDEQTLRKYLLYVVVNDLDFLLESDLSAQLNLGEDEKILESVYMGMEEEDRLVFLKAIREGLWGEYIDYLDESFEVDWGRTRMVDSGEVKS